MKITVQESKKNEAKSFDYKDVEDDAKQFDFQSVLDSLSIFKGWLKSLHSAVGSFDDPALTPSAHGSSGYCYRIHSAVSAPIDFSIRCGTNPERYPEFEGSISVGREYFDVKSTKDLNGALVKKIAAAYKKAAGKAEG